MRKPEVAAVRALVLLPLLLSPATANAGSHVLVAQTDSQASQLAPSAPGQPPSAAGTPHGPATVVAPAEKGALSTPACSVKYLEAKVAGKLHGRKWVDFRRDECRKRETTAVFPSAISPKYQDEKDLDKARTKTCADQFTANKASNANGGLVWVEKDGGYYAECIMRLKG